MKRLTATWTTALATAALLALPAAGGAQTPQTPPEPQPEQSTTLSTPANQNPANQSESPADHLRQAKDALANIDANTVPARAKSQIAALRRHINNLERSVAGNDNASATGEARRSSKATAGARGNVNWGNEVAAIDRIITQLAGTGSASMTGTGDPGTAGTSGTERGSRPSASATLDDSVRNQLLQVRTHITAFAAAMSGTASSSPSSPSPSMTGSPTAPSTSGSPTAAPSTTPSSTEPSSTEPSSTEPSSTQSPTSATPTPNPEGQTQPQTQSGATTAGQTGTMTGQPGVDTEAAKQHLTAARDTLTQLTQLPAAAQLQGEARTQVSQLIQNFNELITTQANWRESYEKLEANITALIGPAQVSAEASATTSPAATPQTEPANPPATPPANPPAQAGTQGTAGAVGTSGTVTLDPAIRQKLVEFRQHLVAFHSAAGGDVKDVK